MEKWRVALERLIVYACRGYIQVVINWRIPVLVLFLALPMVKSGISIVIVTRDGGIIQTPKNTSNQPTLAIQLPPRANIHISITGIPEAIHDSEVVVRRGIVGRESSQHAACGFQAAVEKRQGFVHVGEYGEAED